MVLLVVTGPTVPVTLRRALVVNSKWLANEATRPYAEIAYAGSGTSQSMSGRNGATQFHIPLDKREWVGGAGDQHQHLEHIDVGRIAFLHLHLLADPCKRLLLRLRKRATPAPRNNLSLASTSPGMRRSTS
jgi:hypothetical protein